MLSCRPVVCFRALIRIMSFLSTGITGYGYGLKIVSSGWSFVSAVLGQMSYLVASLTLDSARTYVMQGASFTQGTISSIPIGGSISPEGFLLPVLLLVVIIVTVVIVIVILIVVVDDVSLILKLSASSVKVPVAYVTLFSSAQWLRENTDSGSASKPANELTDFPPLAPPFESSRSVSVGLTIHLPLMQLVLLGAKEMPSN
ncbi:hypothetical protein Tco_0216542 [Tanacetum coccineum]